MEAIEKSVPLYECISEKISFGLAGPLRRRAITRLVPYRAGWVLDSGAGPGVSSRMLLSSGFERVVGLDPSAKLLNFARSGLGEGFHPVVGVSENLPFRSRSFGCILVCFSLRDVRDIIKTLREFATVVKSKGSLAVVDIGKPDARFPRAIASIYIHFGMPILASLLVRGRLRGNPFRMIVPTFRPLLPNRRLSNLIAREFGPSELNQFIFGVLVVIVADYGGKG